MFDRSIIPIELITKKIYLIRGRRVMMDFDLADMYEIRTKRLKEQVKRNIKRFPDDFMFELTKSELRNWRSQIATSNSYIKMGLRISPFAFTEQGVAMLSSVLNSDRAIQVNIQIMRAFVNLKSLILSNAELRSLIEKLRKDVDKHGIKIKENKDQVLALAALVKQILDISRKKSANKIGFKAVE